ncbi:MAG: sugar phosphate nucleotidyltransferase, partial [Hyphomicrobium sp.]
YLTYGDGVANVDIKALTAHHKKSGKHATVTAVSQPGRFGSLRLDGTNVTEFVEKPDVDNQMINGGFFVLSPAIFDYIEGDATVWEFEPLRKLASHGQLNAYLHRGFWQPMDTIREREVLEGMWACGNAHWLKSTP